MKRVDLSALPYKHRFAGASLLLAKANRLCGLDSAGSTEPNPKAIVTALAFYDMALSLLKPYDPNYSTVVNWKCNLLRELGQHAEAASWYREIVRLSDETDGKGMRNPTASLAERMLRSCDGLANEPLQLSPETAEQFDEPPYCMFADEFCRLLAEQKFKKAHACLSPLLRQRVSIEGLKRDWKQMTRGAKAADLTVALEQHVLEWPARKAEDIGWCYYSVSTETLSEGLTVVVGRTPQQTFWITGLEFGRP